MFMTRAPIARIHAQLFSPRKRKPPLKDGFPFCDLLSFRGQPDYVAGVASFFGICFSVSVPTSLVSPALISTVWRAEPWPFMLA